MDSEVNASFVLGGYRKGALLRFPSKRDNRENKSLKKLFIYSGCLMSFKGLKLIHTHTKKTFNCGKKVSPSKVYKKRTVKLMV